MNSEKKILIAFILNLSFSVFEFVGGIFTGSIAILSDSVHDMCDAASIGISFFFEKKSRKQPDDIYTYGYGRYSVLGGIITTLFLLVGSVMVIYNAVNRIMHPIEINCNGMILFAFVGVFINLGAAFLTRGNNSLNQKAVNLHMLEDVLGWIVVLFGAFVMKITKFSFIDPIMSIGVAVFILINVIKNLKKVVDLFLEKAPLDVNEVKESIIQIDGVLDVHHIHIWSMDGERNYATMHVVVHGDSLKLKETIRKVLHKHDISHTTLELEKEGEQCYYQDCHVELNPCLGHRHHHH